MKITKTLSVLLFFTIINGCKKSEDVVPLTTKQCLLNQYNIEDEDFLSLSYTANKLSKISFNLFEEPLVTTVTLNTNGDISSMNFDGTAIDITYVNNLATKMTEKEEGVATGEKILTYTGKNVTKLEYFLIENGKKELASTHLFSYDAKGNLIKFSLKLEDFSGNEIVLLDGGKYDSKANQFGAISNNLKLYFFAAADIFLFVPSFLVPSFISPNNITEGTFKNGFIELLLEGLFGGTIPTDINKALPSISFSNTFSYTPEGYPLKTNTNYTTEDGKESFASDYKYSCLN